MATLTDLLDDVHRARNAAERMQARDTWMSPPLAKIGHRAVEAGLVEDDGEGGWELTPDGVAARTLDGRLRQAAKAVDTAQDELAAAIREARDAGLPLRTIAAATGLNHQTVANIAAREQD